MAQSVEQLIRNQQVAGSNPATSSTAHLVYAEWAVFVAFTIIRKVCILLELFGDL